MFVPQKILVVATRQIGDVLITTPLIHRAKQIWPGATIDVLGYDNTMGMLEGNADIHQVIESPEHPEWSEYKFLIQKIFRKYDLAIVSQPSDRAHLYGLLAAPKRIGIVPEKPLHNWWKKLICRHTVTLDYMRQHVVTEKFRLLDPYDADKNHIPKVIPPTVEHLPKSIETRLSESYVVIHATPMWRFKRWATTGWSEVIKSLINKGMRIVLTGSSSLQDREINQKILEVLTHDDQNKIINLTGMLSLAETAKLLEKAKGYIGVDTSITHLAAACGTPTIAIFGATPPTNYGPWPKNFSGAQPWTLTGPEPSNHARNQTQHNIRIIQGIGSCVPCRKSGCLNQFDSHSDCLDKLSATIVIDAINDHLKLPSDLKSTSQSLLIGAD